MNWFLKHNAWDASKAVGAWILLKKSSKMPVGMNLNQNPRPVSEINAISYVGGRIAKSGYSNGYSGPGKKNQKNFFITRFSH